MVLQRRPGTPALSEYEKKKISQTINTSEMTLKKKIIANFIVLVLAIPAIAIFNDSEEMVWVNFLGLAYTVLMVKIAPFFLPWWVVDYFKSIPEEDEEDYF